MHHDDHLVTPGERVNLDHLPTAVGDNDLKHFARSEMERLTADIVSKQDMLRAQDSHRVLVIFQAIDTGGKDGVIKNVFGPIHPQGVRVVQFKAPTAPELERDYLWRVHAQVPADGELVVFNRSHYEDILTVRVHDMVPRNTWRRRYRHIRDFERMLTDEGTTIVKFFLHISKDEQRERLQARVDDPTKRWKFDPNDLLERKLWDGYRNAFEDMVSETSTGWAPWHVIPADRKWYRDLAVATVVSHTLGRLDLSYPPGEDHLDELIIE